MQSIPFIDLQAQRLRVKDEVDARMQAVLDHGVFIQGPEVAELEQALAEFVGGGDVVGVASGTDALLMALMALDIGTGDAVFVPAFTFTATAEVVLLLGATPVFVDVDPGSFNLAVDDLVSKIEQVRAANNVAPKAVIAVDLFGLPADYPRLQSVCGAQGLHLIADAAQSLSGAIGDTNVGRLAPITATSFFPAKPLGCFGDGGAVFAADPEIAAQLRSIRAHGKGAGKYDIVRVGVNGRLDTLQAAVLLAKLPILSDEQQRREKLSRYYDERLAGIVRAPERIDEYRSAWAQYTIQVDSRDDVQSFMADAGIPTQVYYPRPMHLQPAYRHLSNGEGSLPVSEALSERVLSLPMHPYMSDETAAYICDKLIETVAGGS